MNSPVVKPRFSGRWTESDKATSHIAISDPTKKKPKTQGKDELYKRSVLKVTLCGNNEDQVETEDDIQPKLNKQRRPRKEDLSKFGEKVFLVDGAQKNVLLSQHQAGNLESVQSNLHGPIIVLGETNEIIG